MVAFLESQIGLLETGWEAQGPVPAEAERVRLAEDLIAFHLTTLERLEGHLGAGGLAERDRPLVPLFRRWLDSARKVKELVRVLQTSGLQAGGYDDLLRAINRSKPVAESFDRFVELNARLAEEERSRPPAVGG